MLEPLGYPRGLLAVEKNLFQKSVSRRVDIVCFYKMEKALKPLLLIECKAEGLGLAAENQLLGYNDFLGAPFFCLADEKGETCFWREEGGMRSVPYLPSYPQLRKALCIHPKTD